MTRQRFEELETMVRQISDDLKGPMSSIERALLVADRKDIRQELADAEIEDM